MRFNATKKIIFLLTIAVLSVPIAFAGKLPIIGVTHTLTKNPFIETADVTGVIIITIPAGWHLYAPGADEKYISLSIEPGQGPISGVVFTYPDGEMKMLLSDLVPLYHGEVTIEFTATLIEANGGVWRPMIRWQTCSEEICLLPEKRSLEIVIPAG